MYVEPLLRDLCAIVNSLTGSCLTPYTGQCQSQQRSFGGGTFHLQAMEAFIPLRRALHRDKPCPWEILGTFLATS
jgi:hypothetical protein